MHAYRQNSPEEIEQFLRDVQNAIHWAKSINSGQVADLMRLKFDIMTREWPVIDMNYEASIDPGKTEG